MKENHMGGLHGPSSWKIEVQAWCQKNGRSGPSLLQKPDTALIRSRLGCTFPARPRLSHSAGGTEGRKNGPHWVRDCKRSSLVVTSCQPLAPLAPLPADTSGVSFYSSLETTTKNRPNNNLDDNNRRWETAVCFVPGGLPRSSSSLVLPSC